MIWALFYLPWLATCHNKRLGFVVTSGFVAAHYSTFSESALREYMVLTLKKWRTRTFRYFCGKTKSPTCPNPRNQSLKSSLSSAGS